MGQAPTGQADPNQPKAGEKQKRPLSWPFPTLMSHAQKQLFLAEWTGLEPATPGVTGRYSNQLNYHSRLFFS